MNELEHVIAMQSQKADRWAKVSVVAQYAEAADVPAEAMAKWSRIYRLFNASGEAQQDEVFAAVGMYFLKNGCSPEGGYSKPIRTAGGVEVQAGEVIKVIGRLEGQIRQFMRGKLEDSYLFLKHNPAVRDDEALRVKAENCGVPAKYCYLLADWLGNDCQYFVGEEASYYSSLRSSLIARAKLRRADAGSHRKDRVMDDAPETQLAGHHHLGVSPGATTPLFG